MKKAAMAECFLCEQLGKGKRITFYSGIKKGGTKHELLSCTVTFFERWSDLTMHEMHVCRECGTRLWRQQHRLPGVLYGAGAGAVVLLAPLGLLLPEGAPMITALALAAVAALGLGGACAYYLRLYRAGKPKQSEVEPLVVAEAAAKLDDGEGRTYLTSDQYLERHAKGIIG